MLIGELSKRTGVHRHQLRYYEAQGLLEPGRSVGGYREYADEAVLAVAQIRRLLEAGLSTQEIAFLQPCISGTIPDFEPCAALLATLEARLDALDQQIEALTRTRHALHTHIETTKRRVAEAGNGEFARHR